MTIKSILIANRGEIAIRIMETAKKMGISTYAIKSSKEPKAMYLQFCDNILDVSDQIEEIPIFLDIEAIIKLAKEQNISAVHPGYGFLAESPYFAQRCEEEGIVYIGPSPDAIYKMGNKTIAKQIAKKHGIPLLEGSLASLKSIDEAQKVADKVGYPIIIKAAAGGGGRGMRIVEYSKDLKKNFKLATAEAEKAFNDPSVFIEKYVRNPRHIEFQIVGDKHGNIVHLGERECSIQRKHQKLLEEAPSVALDDKMRIMMGQEAIKLAKAVNYHSLGTVEFLLDDSNNFYFMEMNTRIQVEHPVTEFVTGLDLVELMIKIANGEKLNFKQEDIKLNGWAIECRINAEDVQTGFSPNLGVIEKISFPKGKNIRIDTGVQNGSEITPHFDSMIAKLICYGENREKVISNTLTALRRVKIQGLKTTIPFHKAVLQNKAFKKGNFNTSFISNNLDQTFFQENDEELMAAFAATYHFLSEIIDDEETTTDYSRGKNLSPWTLKKRLKSM